MVEQQYANKNKGGENMCSSLASEGGAEAIGANPTDLSILVCGSISFGRRCENQEEEGGEGEHGKGQGEDDTPEGWTFLKLS